MAPSRRSKRQATAPLLKGYLPVRLCLPPTADGREDDTYFYVKEHRDNNSSSSSSSTSSTLFVANAPVVPPVATKLLLQSIFARFGDVTRVTVVPNPRQQQQQQQSVTTTTASLDEGIFWTDHFAAPSYFLHGKSATREDEKRFAHIVFSSPKEMKACLQSLHQVMAASSSEDEKTITSDHAKKDESDSDSSDEEEDEDEDGSSQDDNDKDDQRNAQSPGLVLDPIELQTLADETDRLYRQEHGLDAVESSDIDSDDEQEKRRKQREAKKKKKKRSPVVIVAERYRETSCTTQSDRQALLEECNRVMQEYEDEQARQLAASTGSDGEPAVDDDGFVTVTYGGAAGGDVGSGSGKRALDDAPVHEQGQKRRKGQKRSRGSATGKKKRTGASQLDDFYRFQTKDNKKKTLHELRERFEQDLAKVQKMKQQRKYRPF